MHGAFFLHVVQFQNFDAISRNPANTTPSTTTCYNHTKTMGAHSFEDSASKKSYKTSKEAYKALCENAEWRYGDSPYNGTISTTCGFFMCSPPKDRKEYNDILDKCDKWEECACYETDDKWVFFGMAAS